MSLTPDQETESQNMEQLRLLGTFYMIKAILEFAVALVLVLFVGGLGGILKLISDHVHDPGPLLGLALTLPLLISAVTLLPLAFVDFLVARGLPRRRRRVLGQAAAVIACLEFPIGTILGASTLFVLSKSTVKAMFER